MGAFWIRLWMGLLLCQVFTTWIIRSLLASGHQELPLASEDLVNLAILTNGRFEQAMGPHPAVQADEGHAPDAILKREDLIIELRQLQEDLLLNGVDAEIVEDLEAFMAGLNGRESTTLLNQYIRALIQWIESLEEGEGNCRMRRLALHPPGGGSLPQVAFELSGSLPEIGRRMHRSASGPSPWSLMEMDILPEGDHGGWWVRGSCSFDRPVSP